MATLTLALARIDFETKSRSNLKKVGAFRYAEDPSTDILCLAYELPGKRVRLWHPGLPPPFDLLAHVHAGGNLESHNAEFEFNIWNKVAVRRYSFPKLPINRFTCSAAKAAVLAFPRGLDLLGVALNLPVRKDKQGHATMMKYSQPRKPTKAELRGPGPVKEWHDDPLDLEELYAYCVQDVVTEKMASERMIPLRPRAQRLWELTTTINERGLLIDRKLCQVAQRFALQFSQELTKELHRLTSGHILTAKQNAKMKTWLEARDVALPNLQAKTIEDRLKADRGGMNRDARRVLEIRLALNKASVSKFTSLLNTSCADGRVRGALLFNGASTGRYTGRFAQLHNLAKATVREVPTILAALELGDYDFFRRLYPDVLNALLSVVRPMIVAAKGHTLMGGDFAAIEARVILWLAGDEENLNEYRKGVDPYVTMAALIHDCPVKDVTKAFRELGKRAVLGCGFGMGWKKFFLTCEKYNVPVSKDLAKKAVRAYRTKYEPVKLFWYALENAVIDAIQNPGRLMKVNRLQVLVKRGFLQIRLPSGRILYYAQPKVVKGEVSWEDDEGVRHSMVKDQIVFRSVHEKTKQWVWEYTYGGKLAENVTQATAADLMTGGMERLEEKGYRPILSIHDEIIGEPPIGHGSLDEFRDLMAFVPAWAEGLPVKVEAWTNPRYIKQ